MKKIFEAVSLGNLQLKNRLVRSATLEAGGAENGKITPLLGQAYDRLSEGGVALIITGMMGVAPNACIFSGMTKIYDDSFASRFQQVAEIVHGNDTKLVVQLGHCGAKSAELDGWDYPLAPSDCDKARAMPKEQIDSLVRSYGAVAIKCRDAGADGVQIHAAHGYLISQFLSPIYNKRTDEYGGAIDGRARLLIEVYEEIREQVGNEYPVMVKINYSDIAAGGIEEADVLRFCKELDKRGIDAIEVSAGIGVDASSGSVQGNRRDEGFNAPYALTLSQNIDAAVVSVGGYRSVGAIEKALNSGNIAAVSMCRALIRDPALPSKWRDGSLEASTCVSCSKCFRSETLGCYLDQAH